MISGVLLAYFCGSICFTPVRFACYSNSITHIQIPKVANNSETNFSQPNYSTSHELLFLFFDRFRSARGSEDEKPVLSVIVRGGGRRRETDVGHNAHATNPDVACLILFGFQFLPFWDNAKERWSARNEFRHCKDSARQLEIYRKEGEEKTNGTREKRNQGD